MARVSGTEGPDGYSGPAVPPTTGSPLTALKPPHVRQPDPNPMREGLVSGITADAQRCRIQAHLEKTETALGTANRGDLARGADYKCVEKLEE